MQLGAAWFGIHTGATSPGIPCAESAKGVAHWATPVRKAFQPQQQQRQRICVPAELHAPLAMAVPANCLPCDASRPVLTLDRRRRVSFAAPLSFSTHRSRSRAVGACTTNDLSTERIARAFGVPGMSSRAFALRLASGSLRCTVYVWGTPCGLGRADLGAEQGVSQGAGWGARIRAQASSGQGAGEGLLWVWVRACYGRG